MTLLNLWDADTDKSHGHLQGPAPQRGDTLSVKRDGDTEYKSYLIVDVTHVYQGLTLRQCDLKVKP